MSTANWSAIDPHEDNNSDLFGTDIFGDDIFDMYNSSDVTGEFFLRSVLLWNVNCAWASFLFLPCPDHVN